MYAVIESGGKQYRVAVGDKVRIEKLPASAGESVSLDKVLLVCENDEVRVGTPLLAGVTVTATVTKHGRAPKIRIFKTRRRKHYRKHAGHRQDYTELEIMTIAGKGAGAGKDKTD